MSSKSNAVDLGVTRWRKKPVIVDMIKWDASDQAFNAISNNGGKPEFVSIPGGQLRIWVEKSQAWMYLSLNDWAVIESDNSGVYPCTASVHVASYEPVFV